MKILVLGPDKFNHQHGLGPDTQQQKKPCTAKKKPPPPLVRFMSLINVRKLMKLSDIDLARVGMMHK